MYGTQLLLGERRSLIVTGNAADRMPARLYEHADDEHAEVHGETAIAGSSERRDKMMAELVVSACDDEVKCIDSPSKDDRRAWVTQQLGLACDWVKAVLSVLLEPKDR